jgi:hypothetical protein
MQLREKLKILGNENMQRILLTVGLIITVSIHVHSWAQQVNHIHTSLGIHSSLVQAEEIVHECKFCATKFQSRNALFRHVRTDPQCSREAGSESVESQIQPVRYSLALQFSYWGVHNCTAENSGELLLQSLQTAINDFIQSNLNSSIKSQFISDTQVTIPRLRHKALAQEFGCFAANDVKVVNFLAPKGLILSQSHVDSSRDYTRSFLNDILIHTNSILPSKVQFIRLHGIKLLPSHSKFHAERCCTQRIYHYILPLRWLPNGSDLERWWIENNVVDDIGPHRNRATKRPPSDALTLLKKAGMLYEGRITTSKRENCCWKIREIKFERKITMA